MAEFRVKAMSEKRFMIEIINKAVEASEELMKCHRSVLFAQAEEQALRFNVQQLGKIIEMVKYRDSLIAQLDPSEVDVLEEESVL